MISILSIDQALFSFINQTLSNPFFDYLMPIIRNKSTWIPLYILLLIYFLLQSKNRNSLFLFIAFVLLAIFVSDSIICNSLKALIHRIRPCNAYLSDFPVRLVLSHCSSGFSFPSAHAANHASLATLFIFYIRKFNKHNLISIAFALWACSIAFAQVYVGVHYPIDVLAGLLIGLLNGCLFYFSYQRAISYFYTDKTNQ